MKETFINLIFRPKLEKPILIAGLPEMGNVGKITAQMLIESSHAELFAELYSPSFPDYVVIDKEGICRPPRYEFFASTFGRNLIILTGDAQIPLEDIPAYYEVCGKVLDFISDLNCRFIVTVGSIPSAHSSAEIYVAATSHKLATKYAKNGAAIYKGERIAGVCGLLLGLAKATGLRGVCVLGSSLEPSMDQEAALNIYKFLRNAFRVETWR